MMDAEIRIIPAGFVYHVYVILIFTTNFTRIKKFHSLYIIGRSVKYVFGSEGDYC